METDVKGKKITPMIEPNAQPVALFSSAETVDGNWDEQALGEDAVFVDVWLTQDAYLIVKASDTSPTNVPAGYAGGLTHRIPCKNMTYLHYKQVSSSGTMTVTVFKTKETPNET